MLKKDRVQKELRKMRKNQTLSKSEVAAGLRRLAFGSVADAIRLLMEDLDSLPIESLDLYNISEIKRTTGKGVEIKFFDRLKALERLAELTENSNSSAAEAFFKSLRPEETKNNEI